jgi:NAD(P)-dependent dehydrogenase (short-subunit alcohol dehydrogenase family)
MKDRKVVVITGANRGIGLAAGQQLIKLGHRVVFTGRNHDKLAAATKDLGERAITKVLDVTDHKSISAFADWAKKEFGTIDALVNNAGSIFDPPTPPGKTSTALSTPLDKLRETFALNLFGAYDLTQTLLPLLNRQKRSDVINVSSGLGALTDMGAGYTTYRMSKAALNAMTKNMAAELVGSTVHVNSVCPGWCHTDLGGPSAPRTPQQGAHGIVWILDQEPDIRGEFYRDEQVIPF